MKSIVRCLIQFVFISCILPANKISFAHASLFFLDYTLYSQLLNDLQSDASEDQASSIQNYSSINNQNEIISNYFNLNKKTIQKYNNYLHFSEAERERLKNLSKEMFEFGYDSYMKYAFPLDELDPIHCKGRGPDYSNPDNININDALGDYLLTLVDSLSSLVVFGNSTEFKRASRLVIENLDFDKDNTVQVFEATIRFKLFPYSLRLKLNELNII